MSTASLLYVAAAAIAALALAAGWRHRQRPLDVPLAATGLALALWLGLHALAPAHDATRYLLISLWPAMGLHTSVAARSQTGVYYRRVGAIWIVSIVLAVAVVAWNGTFDTGLQALGLPAAGGFDARILLGIGAAILLAALLDAVRGLITARWAPPQVTAAAALLLAAMLGTVIADLVGIDGSATALAVPAAFALLSILAWQRQGPLELPLRPGSLGHTSEALLVVDGNGQIQQATPGAIDLLAGERRAVVGTNVRRIINLDWAQLQLLEHTLAPGHTHTVPQHDGSVLNMNVTLLHGRRGEPLMALLRLSPDHSHWLPASAELRDADTGIPGVALGEALIEQEIRRRKDGNGTKAAVIFFRFGNLDAVRAAHGDELAIRWFNAVVARLTYGAGAEVVRSGDGGFAALITDPDEAEQAERLAERLRAMLARPFIIDERSITPQVHVAVVPDLRQYQNLDDMLADAQQALIGDGDEAEHRVHSTTAAAGARADRALRLEAALSGQALELSYDIVMNWREQAGIGCRVRLRWDSEDQAPVHTAELLRIASRTHMVAPLIDWLLKTLADQVGALTPVHGEPRFFLPVSDELLSQVTHALQDRLPNSGLQGTSLILEVSAHSCAHPSWRQRFNALAELGVRLHLTDYSAQPLLALQAQGLALYSAGLAPQLQDAILHKRPGRHLVQELAVTAHNIGCSLRADAVASADMLKLFDDVDVKYLWGPAIGSALDAETASRLLRAPGALHERLGLRPNKRR